MPKAWLRTQSSFNPQEDVWGPNFHGEAASGYVTITSQGTGAPWFGLVCAEDAAWTKWRGMGAVTVFDTLDAAVAEALRLGGTAEAARVADVRCAGAA